MGGKLAHVNPLHFPSSHPSTNPFHAAMLRVHKTSPYEYLMCNSCNANSTLFYFPSTQSIILPKCCDISLDSLVGVQRLCTNTLPLPQRHDLSIQVHKGEDIYAWFSIVWMLMQTTYINYHANGISGRGK